MDAWLDEVLAILLDMLEKGEEIPDEVYAAIVQAIEGEALSPEGPLIQPAAESKITPIPASEHESSNVNGFKYDPKTGKLLVQFHGPYPQAEGSVYQYSDVPEYIVDIFARGAIGPKTSGQNRFHKWIRGVSPSLGGSLNALLKAGKFSYKKVA